MDEEETIFEDDAFLAEVSQLEAAVATPTLHEPNSGPRARGMDEEETVFEDDAFLAEVSQLEAAALAQRQAAQEAGMPRGDESPQDGVDGARSRAAGAAQLDSDTVDAIFARLVSSGTAEQLCRCACVCTLWAAASMDDALWRVLLLRRCGGGAGAMLEALDAAQRAAREPAASCRALYIRSVTTRVLLWGHCDEAGEDSSSAPRVPALFGPLSESGEAHRVVRQASAGNGFVCAVTWGGTVLCWGMNLQGQCGVEPFPDPGSEVEDFTNLETYQYIAQPNTLALPPAHYALQVSCGEKHAACVVSGGAVFCWGDSGMCQLGNHPDDASYSGWCAAVPVRPALPDGAGAMLAVCCGGEHTVALGHDHAVYAWGDNGKGQARVLKQSALIGHYGIAVKRDRRES